MRYSTASLLVLGLATAGEVMAGPAHGHAHAHRHVHKHEKKDVDWNSLDWNAMGIDWVSAWKAGQEKTSTVAPASSSTPTQASSAPAASSPAANDAADQASDESALTLFNNVVGASNSRTSFGAQTAAKGSVGDAYIGNTGSPYGSNVIKVSSTNGYAFTNTFVNTQSVPITVNVWQKVGSDGQPFSGATNAPHDTTLTFALKPGGSQIVAFQENTQVAWAQSTNDISPSGAFATTWGEGNFVSSGSGYDVSAIMNNQGNNYNMKITSTQTSCVSDMNQNMWLTDTDPVGSSDGSCFIAQNSATLRTEMGGTV